MMQILGVMLLVAVVSFGLAERGATTVTAFDLHAFVMVLGGSLAAILVSSTTRTTARTLGCLREVLPGLGVLGPGTDTLESQRETLVALWRDGKRAQAVALAEEGGDPVVARMVSLVLERAPEEATRAAFTELNHRTMERWQPAVSNWEVLAKLAPSFGMVGTITGMIQLFQNMGDDTSQLGASISLALVSTLYGVALGAGFAGPTGHYLRNLLD
ncbi:MAG TPA: hypothetical protein DFR83_13295, partial [Deltaproteobacteria bacterium]|nr:hypothetical protein [Deltaproteobacteria bacterium]